MKMNQSFKFILAGVIAAVSAATAQGGVAGCFFPFLPFWGYGGGADYSYVPRVPSYSGYYTAASPVWSVPSFGYPISGFSQCSQGVSSSSWSAGYGSDGCCSPCAPVCQDVTSPPAERRPVQRPAEPRSPRKEREQVFPGGDREKSDKVDPDEVSDPLDGFRRSGPDRTEDRDVPNRRMDDEPLPDSRAGRSDRGTRDSTWEPTDPLRDELPESGRARRPGNDNPLGQDPPAGGRDRSLDDPLRGESDLERDRNRPADDPGRDPADGAGRGSESGLGPAPRGTGSAGDSSLFLEDPSPADSNTAKPGDSGSGGGADTPSSLDFGPDTSPAGDNRTNPGIGLPGTSQFRIDRQEADRSEAVAERRPPSKAAAAHGSQLREVIPSVRLAQRSVTKSLPKVASRSKSPAQIRWIELPQLAGQSRL